MRAPRALIPVMVWIVGAPFWAQTVFFTPDIPTDPGLGMFVQPSEIQEHTAGSYTPALNVPGNADLDAVHAMDAPGNYLFSLQTPSDLAGNLPNPAEPHDVVRYDPINGYSLFFDGDSVADPVPRGSNIDAIYLDTDDNGDLVVSFSIPTSISGTLYESSDLVAYTRFGPGPADWNITSVPFLASTIGAGIPRNYNVIGADRRPGGDWILSFHVPSALAPSGGPATYFADQIVTTDGTTFNLFDTLSSWPVSRRVDGLSCLANPGQVPPTIVLDRLAPVLGDINISWSSSCAGGAQDYAIYEGRLGSFYSHVMLDCSDLGADFTEDVTPAAFDSYYLVVPYNTDEGSYGTASNGLDRPQPAIPDRCVVPKVVTACP